MTSSTDALGNTTYTTYNSFGQVTSTTDPMGNVTRNYYDANGNLTSTVDPSGVATYYTYNSNGLPTVIQDSQGHTVGSFAYNSQGHVIQSTSATGQVQNFVYDANGNQVVSYYVWTDGTSTKTIVSRTDYDRENHAIGTEQYEIAGQQSFTSAAQLDSYTPTQSTSTVYNATGQVQESIDANGNQTWTFYDARGLVVETMQESDTNWLVTRTIYDNNGRAVYTTDSFLAGGNLSPLLPGEGQGEGAQGTHTIYDGLGRVVSTQRLDGLWIEMYQDVNGQWDTRLQSGYTPTVISTSGTTYNDAGQVAETTDQYGTQTQYTYDADGRTIETRTQSRDQNGNLVWLVNRTVYDVAGRTIASTDQYVDGTSTANITGTLYVYDSDGRTTCTEHVQGLDIEIVSGVSTVASYGAVVWQTESVYDSQGRLSYSIGQHAPGQDGPRTDYYYDTYGRQIAVLGPVENAAGYASPVRPLTEYVYDTAGQQTSVTTSIALLNTTPNFSTHPDLTVATLDNASAQTTSYQYDALGNRIALTDPDGNTTTWVYNDLGQCTEDTNALNATEHYTYDSSGRLASKTDRDGRVTTYSYDAFGRETAEDWLDSQSNVIYSLTYTYDAEGDLLSASDPAATYTYSYDAYGRATSITIAIPGLTPTVVFAQQFDDFGNRTQLSATIGGTDDFTNDYVYNAVGLLAEVEQHGEAGGDAVAEKRVDFTYNSDSLLDTLARYGDLGGTELVATSTYGYDLLGQLTSLVHSKGTTTLAGYAWTYDGVGNLTQEVSTVDGTANYANDATGQLTGADYSGAQTDESYSYDANGNRTNSGYVTGANNRLFSDGTYRYLYDTEGNRVARFTDADGSGTISVGDTDITTYSWDYRDRLTQVTHYASYATYSGSQPDQVVQYAYDYQNHLVKKVLDSNGDGTADSSSIYVYDGSQIALQFDHSGSGSATASDLSHRYLWGQAVDQVLADEKVTSLGSAGSVVWPLTDRLGTARDLATYDAQNDVTTIANHRVYNAYGALQSQTNAAVDCLFGYTGRQFDSDTGLQNNLNRWYDPAVGRWLSEDPTSFGAGDTNLNRYVGNSPTTATDPSGNAAITNALLGTAVHSFLNRAFEGFTPVLPGAFATGMTPGPRLPAGPGSVGLIDRWSNRRISSIAARYGCVSINITRPDFVEVNNATAPRSGDLYELKPLSTFDAIGGTSVIMTGDLAFYYGGLNLSVPTVSWSLGRSWIPGITVWPAFRDPRMLPGDVLVTMDDYALMPGAIFYNIVGIADVSELTAAATAGFAAMAAVSMELVGVEAAGTLASTEAVAAVIFDFNELQNDAGIDTMIDMEMAA